MKIAIVGYGRMGREVEALALEAGHEVVARLGRDDAVNADTLAGAEVAVEFTLPDSAPDTLVALARAGVPAATGTTGWYDDLPRVRAAVEEAGTGLVYAPNFSIGVAVFRRWVDAMARDLDGLEDYDVALHETHHTGKVDHPSGTARMLADTIVEATARKTRWAEWPASGPDIDPATLQVTSARVGRVPGTHEIAVDGPDDRITLTHTARNRRGFARGALLAAGWIRTRSGVFTLEDVLADRLGPGPGP